MSMEQIAATSSSPATITRRLRPKAKNGQKAHARAAAVAAGRKTFHWHCHKGHGLTLFSTAGTGQCRTCMALNSQTYLKRKNQEEAHRST